MEGLYLIWTKEYIDLLEEVYKIGRSKNIQKRLNGYKPGYKIIFTILCTNSNKFEKKVIALFNQKFKLIQGREFFKGDSVQMIDYIKKIYCSECKIDNIPNDITNIHVLFTEENLTKKQILEKINNVNTKTRNRIFVHVHT